MEQDTVQIIITLTFFIIGSLFGSFFTLATYRIPRRQDVWIKRSYCPNCKHNLGFFDCFPILSYISTVGRCKYCKGIISYRYLLIEVVCGLVFVISYVLFGLSLNLVIFLACYIFLFLYIGSEIMTIKMTKEEKKEIDEFVKRIKEEKKSKLIKTKKGLINVEILVAIVVFIIYFTSTIHISRNYRKDLEEYKRKSDALNLCMNRIETLKASNVDEIEAERNTVDLEGTHYVIETTISTYLKEGYIETSNAKEVTVTVRYSFVEETKIITLSFIKEVELI